MTYRFTSIIFCIILSIVFFTLGCISTIWMKKSELFTLSNEISLTDSISIVLTIILALFIAYYVDKNKDIKRITKDMFISYYISYLDFLRLRMTEIIEEQALSKKSSYFKIIRIRLHSLNKSCIERKIVKNDILIKKLVAEVTSLWKVSTESKLIKEEGKEKIELSLIRIEGIINQITFEINEK